MTTTMDISAEAVKRLREQTGAGFMDCKRALQETSGDVDKAVLLLGAIENRYGGSCRDGRINLPPGGSSEREDRQR